MFLFSGGPVPQVTIPNPPSVEDIICGPVSLFSGGPFLQVTFASPPPVDYIICCP